MGWTCIDMQSHALTPLRPPQSVISANGLLYRLEFEAYGIGVDGSGPEGSVALRRVGRRAKVFFLARVSVGPRWMIDSGIAFPRLQVRRY